MATHFADQVGPGTHYLNQTGPEPHRDFPLSPGIKGVHSHDLGSPCFNFCILLMRWEAVTGQFQEAWRPGE